MLRDFVAATLGAILYELLTGRPPFRGESPWDTVLQVLTEEPVPPRRLQPKVLRDLETICLKCLHKEPDKRYTSAEELADDLQRFLAGESIRARPASFGEHAVKWARRRPAAAALVAVSSLALLSLLGGAWWHNARLRDERDEVDRQKQEAQAQRDKAQEWLRQALEAVNLPTQVGLDLLAHTPQMDQVRRQILEVALRYYQRFLKENGADPIVRKETALAYYHVGYIQQMLGKQKPAEDAFRQALELQQKLVNDFPTLANLQQDLARSHNSLGLLLRAMSRPKEAEESLRQALELHQKLAGAFPTQPDYRQKMATSHLSLGLLLAATGRRSDAEAAYRQALKLQQQLAQEFPARPGYRHDLAQTYNNLGTVLGRMKRTPEAVLAFRQALGFWQKLADDDPQRPDYRKELANAHNNLGLELQSTPGDAEAVPAFQRAMELQQQLVRDFPDHPDYRFALATTCFNLSNRLQATGCRSEAEPIARQAVQLWQRLADDFPNRPDYQINLGVALSGLANLLLVRKEHGEAAKTAADLPRISSGGWQGYLQAAKFLARCVPLAEQDAKLTEEKRQELAQAYGDQAVQLLRKAVENGFNEGTSLKKDRAFVPLHPRADFKQLMAEIEKKSGGAE